MLYDVCGLLFVALVVACCLLYDVRRLPVCKYCCSLYDGGCVFVASRELCVVRCVCCVVAVALCAVVVIVVCIVCCRMVDVCCVLFDACCLLCVVWRGSLCVD